MKVVVDNKPFAVIFASPLNSECPQHSGKQYSGFDNVAQKGLSILLERGQSYLHLLLVFLVGESTIEGQVKKKSGLHGCTQCFRRTRN